VHRRDLGNNIGEGAKLTMSVRNFMK